MLQIPDPKVPLTADPQGVLYVSATGVDLHSVVGMFEEGASAEGITHEYDSLELPDVYLVIAYYLRNREAVRSMLAEEERRSDELAAEYEKRFPNDLRRKLTDPGSNSGG